MLAPGDFLIQTPPAPVPAPPKEAPAANAVAPDEPGDEPSMSFLMVLLRALGVMHT